MPVGTLGTVKGVSPGELEGLGASLLMANAYHLFLRPGHERVRDLGGIHAFMRWGGPILTDSGGYQVFSLGSINQIRDDGVLFQNHLDGSSHLFTPEKVVEIQRVLGADVIMAFDECPPGGAERAQVERANERTLRWLERCRDRFEEMERHGGCPPQSLFPVVQGNVYDDLRREHARRVRAAGEWDGFAIGGLSVGEAKEDMWRTVELLHGELPEDGPRHLMGVGYPDDLLEAVARGCGVDEPGGSAQPEGCPLQGRHRPDRSGLRLLRLPHLRPGLPPPSPREWRAPGPPPPLDPQPPFLDTPRPGVSAADPRGKLRRMAPGVAGTLPERGCLGSERGA